MFRTVAFLLERGQGEKSKTSFGNVRFLVYHELCDNLNYLPIPTFDLARLACKPVLLLYRFICTHATSVAVKSFARSLQNSVQKQSIIKCLA